MRTELSAEDRAELVHLVAQYAASVDSRDWDRVGALFTEDGVLVAPDPPRTLTPVVASSGRAAVVAAVEQLTVFARTFHHVTGSVWSPAGWGTVEGRTTTEAHHVEAGPEPRSWVWHVVYSDRCQRTDDGWRFVRRELTLAMLEARPVARVLPFELPAD